MIVGVVVGVVRNFVAIQCESSDMLELPVKVYLPVLRRIRLSSILRLVGRRSCTRHGYWGKLSYADIACVQVPGRD